MLIHYVKIIVFAILARVSFPAVEGGDDVIVMLEGVTKNTPFFYGNSEPMLLMTSTVSGLIREIYYDVRHI